MWERFTCMSIRLWTLSLSVSLPLLSHSCFFLPLSQSPTPSCLMAVFLSLSHSFIPLFPSHFPFYLLSLLSQSSCPPAPSDPPPLSLSFCLGVGLSLSMSASLSHKFSLSHTPSLSSFLYLSLTQQTLSASSILILLCWVCTCNRIMQWRARICIFTFIICLKSILQAFIHFTSELNKTEFIEISWMKVIYWTYWASTFNDVEISVWDSVQF